MAMYLDDNEGNFCDPGQCHLESTAAMPVESGMAGNCAFLDGHVDAYYRRETFYLAWPR